LEPTAEQLAGTAAEGAAVARITARLSSQYLLRVVQLLIDTFGDIRAGLLVTAINQANIAGFFRTEEGRRAAGPDGSVPDEARRPISVARLADSTGLPFESTRRIVQRLIDQEVCRHVQGGVVFPRSAAQRPQIVANAIANFSYVHKFVRDLEAAGLVDRADYPIFWADVDDDNVVARFVLGLSAEYVLRALRSLAEVYGDIRKGVVAQTIVTANTAHLDTRPGDGLQFAGVDEPPPDEALKPISVSRLAESLGYPYETMRGHALRLLKAGICARVDGGLIVPTAVVERPQSVRAMLENVGYVRRFMRNMQTLGETHVLREEAGRVRGHFDGDPNIQRYVLHLEREQDPGVRDALRHLLIAEEDRYGSRTERLEKVNWHISECERRISSTRLQIRRLADVAGDARLIQNGEILLANLQDTLALVVDYRRSLLAGLDRSQI
jgi:hypothetical protein